MGGLPAFARRPRTATTPETRALRDDDPAGRFSRGIEPGLARRLGGLFGELRDAEARDPALANAGLAYLLAFAWRAFLESDDVVEGVDVHPAVQTVARLLRADPSAGDLPRLARSAGLSPSHLSRLFKAQTGVPISRYRNQQRLRLFLHPVRRRPAHDGARGGAGRRLRQLRAVPRVFREETGRTPSTLRARHVENGESGPTYTRPDRRRLR